MMNDSPCRHLAALVILSTVLLTAWAGRAAGQSSAQSPSPAENSVLERLQPSQKLEQGIALSATVDPERYTVGPSDAISVGIWTSPPIMQRLDVTPEGTLIIPAVGEIRVAGLSLAEAKAKILAAVKQRYLNVVATATLIKPRSVVVSVRGEVLHEGEYTLYATDRTNQVIALANAPSPTDDAARIAEVGRRMSLRTLIIAHKDGSRSPVDLVKFLATGADSLNPYLREGDVIVVTQRDLSKNVFGIYGEVSLPGRYESVEGDRVSDALLIAQGLTSSAVADSAEFSHLSDDGRTMKLEVINLASLTRGSAADVPLKSGDRIVVRRKSEHRADYRVRVEGEVHFPGTYPITKDRTRISEIIRQAGGFTEYAALEAAELTRHSVQPWEVELDRLMSLRGGLSMEDSLDYIHETDLRLRKEIVNVDFTKILTEQDTLQDVYLQDEDVIHVPPAARTIYVFGQVVSPGHIPFLAGNGPDYYIAKAGGFTERARTDEVKIIKGRTKQWLEAGEAELEEGDYLWVPKDIDRPFAYYMSTAANAAAVLSVIVGMAAVIISLNN
jgi:protein involved in polysaccharide export with SLBB domain